MDSITLIVVDGKLYVPDVYEEPNEFGDKHELLLCVYPAGDCDTLPWPMNGNEYWTKEKWAAALTTALYDAREMGQFVSTVRSAILPDGSSIEF